MTKVVKGRKSTMQVDARVASLIRRLAGYEGRRLSEVLERMLAVYLDETWPNLELTSDDGSRLSRAPMQKG